jgi:hypothetical protein
MPTDSSVQVLLDLEVPVTFIEALLKQHVQTMFSPNGHTNGHTPQPTEEASAPAPASSAGAP